MCGIAGFIDFRKNLDESDLRGMVQTLHHRGPDDNGLEMISTPNVNLGFAHARLSIIDLTSGGSQPMSFGTLKIVFNGEIYNYEEIKEELVELGHQFLSSSDTEVILHAFAQWGVECIDKFIGMFAFVLYDEKSKEVHFVRDRAGVKPLYYYWNKDVLLFASELKALYTIPAFEKEIDSKSLLSYFDFGYVPAPYTIFKNCHKLQAGARMVLNLENKTQQHESYWTASSFYELPKLDLSYTEAKSELKELLISACKYRMVADVPVGVFLSGGYDSTAVTAILQKENPEPLKTFTIGFEEGNNEAPFAKDIANYLGTSHTEYICTTKEGQDIIPDLPYYYDEPFADSSAIPTTLVSKIAREQVTVALSADGGDEVFCGYNVYPGLQKNLKRMAKIPASLKSSAAVFAQLAAKLPMLDDKQRSHLLAVSSSVNADQWKESANLFQRIQSLPLIYKDKILDKKTLAHESGYHMRHPGIINHMEHAMALDYRMYLQDDILTKVDRASMSVSLEGREPLLDHRILEFAAQLPLEYKYDGIETKRILKDIVHDYIPKHMMDRPKAGFSLPIYRWLESDLSYLLDEYLNENALAESGLFDVNFNLNQVKMFKEGKLYFSVYIWRLLMFQLWYAKWMRAA